MKPIYLISNDNPPIYYKAYKDGKVMRLKKVEYKKDEKGREICVGCLVSHAPIKEAINKIKSWVKRGKGRIIKMSEKVLIQEFDVL